MTGFNMPPGVSVRDIPGNEEKGPTVYIVIRESGWEGEREDTVESAYLDEKAAIAEAKRINGWIVERELIE